MMTTAIIAAAGRGNRMHAAVNKVFLPLAGQPVLAHSIAALMNCRDIDDLIIVGAPAELNRIQELLASMSLTKPWQVVAGGSERQYSIANALAMVAPAADIVVIHDGARPLVTTEAVAQVIAAARQYQAAGVGVPVKDTIKVTDAAGFVVDTPPRDHLWAIQTPQAFAVPLLNRAYAQAGQDGFLGTDDAGLVERLGIKVRLVAGDYRNIKITTQEDLIIAGALLAAKGDEQMRVGIGYDVHCLVTERDLVLGGVKIPYDYGLEGHSDADVLLHAIADALLGAAALGDIGQHFPDTDPQYRGISSLKLLNTVNIKLAELGYRVHNIDAIIAAQKPKLAPYIREMQQNIARTIGIKDSQVNIKATTTEGLGFVGHGEGIAAYATVSLSSI